MRETYFVEQTCYLILFGLFVASAALLPFYSSGFATGFAVATCLAIAISIGMVIVKNGAPE